jgi:hypothetical protein
LPPLPPLPPVWQLLLAEQKEFPALSSQAYSLGSAQQ